MTTNRIQELIISPTSPVQVAVAPGFTLVPLINPRPVAPLAAANVLAAQQEILRLAVELAQQQVAAIRWRRGLIAAGMSFQLN